MDLHDALSQLDHIQKQLAHSATFRGYRSLPAALSSGMALLAATAQTLWLPSSPQQPLHFVLLWVSVAVVCGFLQLLEIVVRAWRDGRQVTTRLTVRALEMLVPCLMGGGLPHPGPRLLRSRVALAAARALVAAAQPGHLRLAPRAAPRHLAGRLSLLPLRHWLPRDLPRPLGVFSLVDGPHLRRRPTARVSRALLHPGALS